ncbi:MAG TPA: TonB-dependent receptor [Bacteroidales bacterium]|nr:TonB-dependent receptor [Bacteroidales bacterium]
MKIIYVTVLFSLLYTASLFGQTNGGIVRGRVVNANTNEPIPLASVLILNTTAGTMTDNDGYFTISGIKPGYIEVRVTSVGFTPFISEPVQVTNSNEVKINVSLEETVVGIQGVTINASPFRKKVESPVSSRIISIEEIDMNPGGNRDISKVIQSFPGVASTPAFRNDVIVRGGGPNENRFFIDNVEIPYLNHFSTQGASGGPVGIVNVDFIRSVDFLSGAFPASRGNALSSVMDISLIDGNTEKNTLRATVGASDLGLLYNGMAGKNASLILSARRSYLQYLFNELGLPFLPVYNDFQFKYKLKAGAKSEFILLGIGALDVSELNLDANKTEYQKYLLGYLPDQKQYSYTIGGVYRLFRRNGTDMFVLSRNYLDNAQWKYYDNVVSSTGKIFDFKSGEGDIRFRYEGNRTNSQKLRLSYGAGAEFSRYRNDTFRKNFYDGVTKVETYSTDLSFIKYSLFVQASKAFINERLKLSLGLRSDANTYSSIMSDPIAQLAPRFSASYKLVEGVSLNFNTGRYYQLPPYTALGLRDNYGNYINKDNGVKYIAADHLVFGLEYSPVEAIQLTAESFVKHYLHYPFSTTDSVPLSTKSADYGVFGDESIVSTSSGRAYGVELMGRVRDFYGLNMVVSYTFVRSEFKGANGNFIPTTWDNRNLVSMTATKVFKNNWNVGFRWRFVGGAPYTPYDNNKSSLKEAWDIKNQGYLDYSAYNTKRLRSFNQLDVRVDKQFFFKKWSLMLYADIQNILNDKADQPDRLVQQRDTSGNPLTDPSDNLRYLLKYLRSTTGTILPTIGIIIEI